MSQSPRVPEKAVQAQIVHLLRSIGASVYVLGTVRKRGDHQGTMQTPGICDILAFVRSRLVMIEVKAQGGRFSQPQLAFRLCCETAGVAYVTGGVDEVIAWLNTLPDYQSTPIASTRTGTC